MMPLLYVLAGLSLGGTQTIHGQVVDADTGRPVACRLYIQRAADNTWYYARPAVTGGTAVEYKRKAFNGANSFEYHTCLSAHPFVADLEPGRYALTAEHGKEYIPATVTVEIGKQPTKVRIPLKRCIDLPKRGWYSGDTHVHQPPSAMPTLQAAEDVNVAFPLTFWVTQAHVPPSQGNKNTPVSGPAQPVYIDPTHVYWPINTEYELFTVNGKSHQLGAFFVLNHRTPFELGAPPVTPVATEARRQGGLLELDKHCWEWSMAIIPTMGVDLYELSNNHVWRTEFGLPEWGMPAAEYMRIERSAKGWTEAGWIDYGFQNYYALLNCGFRMRPTGGTATGVHPVPLGWGRVYVHVQGKFSYELWLKGLNDGRSFVTNGPILLATVDGNEPGHVFKRGTGTHRVVAEASSPMPIDRIEIVNNGQVVRTLRPANRKTRAGAYECRIDEPVDIDGSSWIAVRCYESRPDKRVRFAHTGPFHFEITGKPLRPRREEVAYLIQRVQEQITRSAGILPESAIEEYREALRVYESIALSAQ